MSQDAKSVKATFPDALSIKVLHDNYPYAAAVRTAWGFSALVTGAEKTILFDTGSDGTLLLENMAKLQVDAGKIDAIVLSHPHADHTGGLVGFLKGRPNVEVYLLTSFPARLKDAVRRYGAAVIEANEPQGVCPHVHTSGAMGTLLKEQALVVHTHRGLVVLTGCAHPGIAGMVEAIADSHEPPILLLMGGFHLEWATRRKIEKILAAFQRRGIRYVAPTHCSGHKARALFEQRLGRRYVEVGAGKTLTLADLA